jgi:hypothetical protein
MQTLDELCYQGLSDDKSVAAHSDEKVICDKTTLVANQLIIDALRKDRDALQHLLHHANKMVDQLRSRDDRLIEQINLWKDRWFDEYVKTHDVDRDAILKVLHRINFDGSELAIELAQLRSRCEPDSSDEGDK